MRRRSETGPRAGIDTREAVRESDVQAQIVAALQAAGYVVLSTSRVWRRRRCPQCGSWTHAPSGHGDGVSRGVPDLLVTHAAWPVPVWAGVEVKGPSTRVSPEQRALAAAGRIVIARDWQTAVAAVQESERVLYGRVYGRRIREA